VFRDGIWYLQRSTDGFTGIQFGEAGDIPQPADFDNDGRAELAVFRPSTGIWFVYNLTTNQTSAVQFGVNGDKPIVGDYDGDGKADIAVFRPSNGVWYLNRSTDGFIGIKFGESEDKPVPADYDGDGKTDLAVYRPSTATWYFRQSSQAQAKFNSVSQQTFRFLLTMTATEKQTSEFTETAIGLSGEALPDLQVCSLERAPTSPFRARLFFRIYLTFIKEEP
jgi:hypothetical protein